MLIDAHAHLWKGSYGKNKDAILRLAEAYHVDRTYVSALAEDFYPTGDDIEELNGETAAFIREHPDLISGYCYVNPRLESALTSLRRGIESQGMSGMKLWVATFCDDPLVFPLVEQCISYRVPILIHTFYKTVGQLKYESLGANVAGLARRYPEAKIIMAHLGANCYTELKPVIEYKNVSFDISGSLYRRDELDYAVRLLGADRILFGTDSPGVNFLVSRGQVEEADLTNEQRNLIYYKNALKIFDRAV